MTENSSLSDEEAYTTLRRLIPQLAEELDSLRASLRDHNVWLQRYGSAPTAAPHTIFSSTSSYNPTSILPIGTSINTAARIDHSAIVNDAQPESSSISSAKSPPDYIASSASTTPPFSTTNNISDPRHVHVTSLPTSESADAAPTPMNRPAHEDSIDQEEASLQVDPPTQTVEPSPTLYPPYSGPALSNQTVPPTLEVDGPPSYGNTSPPPPPFLPPTPDRDEMTERRDQTAEWLREGEDVLREYSARFAQLGTLLQRPFEDVLGSWQGSHPDNALPDYERVEEREDLMVGGVGEVPPPYVGGIVPTASDVAHGAEVDEVGDVTDAEIDLDDGPEDIGYGDARDVINASRRSQVD